MDSSLLCSSWILHIYLLHALKLTLTTGTFNGIISYTQVADTDLYDVLSINTIQRNWVIRCSMNVVLFVIPFVNLDLVFFSLILELNKWIMENWSIMNLSLGFPPWFYSGMTKLCKNGLSLVSQLYYLTIVVVLFIFKPFSLRLSNRTTHSSIDQSVVLLYFMKLEQAISWCFYSRIMQ